MNVKLSEGGGVKAVFFDMDGTLVYFEATGMKRGMEVLRELGLYSDAVAEAYRFAEEWFRGRVKTYLDRGREVFLEYNRLVLERLGVHEGLDEPEMDVAGAERAGLIPILVDRENRYQGINCMRIIDLTQLLELL